MNFRKAKIQLFLLMVTLWIGLVPETGHARNPFPPSDVVYLSPEENQFYQIINQFRSLLGLPQVEIHLNLQNAAKKHSDWMASQDFLTHYGPSETKTPFQRMEEEGYLHSFTMGENVACGNADPVKTFRQWAFSPGHLANLINPSFKHIGIARSGNGAEQCPYYWTNDFGSLSAPQNNVIPVTDLQKITSAIEKVSGRIPPEVRIELPSNPVSQNQDDPKRFNFIQCMIPYRLSMNVFSFVNQLDAIVDFSKNSSGGYQAKIRYVKNGSSTQYASNDLNAVGVIRTDSDQLLIHSAGIGKNTSFLIQIDLLKNTARFSSTQGQEPFVNEGQIYCSYKN